MKIQTIAKLIPVLLVTTGSLVNAQDSTVTELEGKANQGDAIAQYDLGKMYASGTGVKKDYKKASEWMRKATSQDNFDAHLYLGYMHGKGMGVKRDYDEAWKWINRAIMKFSPSLDKDEPNFEMIVEWMYDKGGSAKGEFLSALGIPDKFPEYRRSLKWNFYAAQLGHAPARKRIYEFASKYRCPYAKTLMGELFFIGKGVKKNNKMAFNFYQKAATSIYDERMVQHTKSEDQGYHPAQLRLGMMYYEGIHVQKNYTEAEKWFTRAAKQGNLQGQLNLGSMYSSGRGVKKDLRNAEKWYKAAAKQGNEYAKEWLKKIKK